MASSTSSPAPGSASKKPLDKMADWFRRALSKKPKKTSSSQHETPATKSSSPAPSPTPEASSSGRWSRDYDICVCHSEEDLAAALELVSYLESGPGGLRCFLQLRDATPGGAIVSELCQALSGSHCRVLLITPGFLKDPWCKHQMLQALSQEPSAEGRTIPLLAGISRDACPVELRFMYSVDGRGPDSGFHQVREAVLRYLQTLR